ncbi:FDLD family class I lanthipeptide [Streptomyces noursei]|uniref:FDLD family class I lanthipeptide n=1 Tax=Streptomyces noursei TaxID=1971 RepID=UPI00045F094A|nr:FDLD family class I lanthipeptide [Streptomyces noursei]AIA02563.1 hypothetical protein DC74_2053 [Streptomyces noursei]
MSDAFDLDAKVSAPPAGSASEMAPLSISSVATRTVCTKVGCSVTKTCVCTSMCTIFC